MGRMLLNDQEVATLVISNSGGQEIKNQDLTITENGTYSADEGFTGLGTVEVNVPTGGGTEINNQDITVTENGTYTAEDGYTGLGTVEVNVPAGSGVEIKNQDIEVTENGTYTADAGYTGLGTVSVNVQGGGSVERFGVPYDALIGTVDKDGNYTVKSSVFEVDLSGVKSVPSRAFFYRFAGANVKKVILDDLISCDAYAFTSMCTNAQSTKDAPIIFSANALETIDKSSVFEQCFHTTYYVEPSFKKLRVVSGSYAFNSCFTSVKIQPDKVFPVLEEITGNQAFSQFSSNMAGDKLYFSKVKKIVGGTATYSTTMNFYNKLKYYYPRLTEVSGYIAYSSGVSEFHFAKAHQALLEACEGYDYKWCGANPDIYFDLMLKITVNGVVYDREHTIDNYTSWIDAEGNLVYTNADTEPDVGTVVYSDQGTTEIGTVTEVE